MVLGLAGRSAAPLRLRSPFWHREVEGSSGSRLCVYSPSFLGFGSGRRLETGATPSLCWNKCSPSVPRPGMVLCGFVGEVMELFSSLFGWSPVDSIDTGGRTFLCGGAGPWWSPCKGGVGLGRFNKAVVFVFSGGSLFFPSGVRGGAGVEGQGDAAGRPCSRAGGMELGRWCEDGGLRRLLRRGREAASIRGSEELGARPRPMCHNRHGVARRSNPHIRFTKLLRDEASSDLRVFVLHRREFRRRRTTSTAGSGCGNIHLRGLFRILFCFEVFPAYVPVHLFFLGLSGRVCVFVSRMYPYY